MTQGTGPLDVALDVRKTRLPKQHLALQLMALRLLQLVQLLQWDRRKLAKRDQKWTSKRLQCNLKLKLEPQEGQLPLFFSLFPLSFTLRSEGNLKVCPFYRGEELLARRLKNENFLPCPRTDYPTTWNTQHWPITQIQFYSTPTGGASFSPTRQLAERMAGRKKGLGQRERVNERKTTQTSGSQERRITATESTQTDF